MNSQEKFQTAITNAVNQAAHDGVHPAIIYMVLGGIQQDVLYSVRQANRVANETAAAENILQSQNSKPVTPANVIKLPK
jgi:hypothetical protein